MTPIDRFCTFNIEEMKINSQLCYDKHKKRLLGYNTRGKLNGNEPGQSLLIDVLRGLKSKWKQVVGADITGSSTSGEELKEFTEKGLDSSTDCGLSILGLASDMGNENRKLWTKLSVSVQRHAVFV